MNKAARAMVRSLFLTVVLCGLALWGGRLTQAWKQVPLTPELDAKRGIASVAQAGYAAAWQRGCAMAQRANQATPTAVGWQQPYGLQVAAHVEPPCAADSAPLLDFSSAEFLRFTTDYAAAGGE